MKSNCLQKYLVLQHVDHDMGCLSLLKAENILTLNYEVIYLTLFLSKTNLNLSIFFKFKAEVCKTRSFICIWYNNVEKLQKAIADNFHFYSYKKRTSISFYQSIQVLDIYIWGAQ